MRADSEQEKLHFTLGEFSTAISFHREVDTVFDISSPWILICDETVWGYLSEHAPAFAQAVAGLPLLRTAEDLPRQEQARSGAAGAVPRGVLILPGGEKAKTMDRVEFILRAAFALGLARDSVFVALGGGALSDVSAFAASIFMRGVRLHIVPSTLLAMVDAGFGGKTGINYAGYKNMVGSIYPASELKICPALLRSLPEEEYLAGLAEVIKSAMIGDPALLELLEERQPDVLAQEADCLNEIIRRSLKVKGDIVEADLREQGVRAHLNLGHTFAHALEASGAFKAWKHGEAVAWGILRALILGESLGETEPAYRQRIERLLGRYGYWLNVSDVPVRELLAAMKRDKKQINGKVRFVLQHHPGKTFQREIEDAEVLAALEWQVADYAETYNRRGR